MPEPNESEQLQAVRDLLREGRTTEADKQLDEIQRQLREEYERRKREEPPPSPMTLQQLTIAFDKALADILGNPPRLTALITELEGKYKEGE